MNGDAFRRRTFLPALHGFLDTVRDGHPSTLIVVITALACPIHEDATGPTHEVSPGRAGATPRDIPEGNGSLTLRRTREYVKQVVSLRQAEDAHLTVLSGLDLLGLDGRGLPARRAAPRPGGARPHHAALHRGA